MGKKETTMNEIPKMITPQWLRKNPGYVFVFGDNLERRGKKGAAICRDEPNAYGFVTKKAPNNRDESFYRPEKYANICYNEMTSLTVYMINNPDKIFLVSRLGAGLANRYSIYEKVIEPMLRALNDHPMVGERVILLP